MAGHVSSIGSSVAEDIAPRRADNPEFREAFDRFRPFEQIARLVVTRRARLGLTQQELAERMGTTKSVISRIESGQHRSGTETLRRLAEALGGHAVIGFEFDSNPASAADLVRL